MGKYERYQKKGKKLEDKASKLRGKADAIRDFVSIVSEDAEKLKAQETELCEAKDYDAAYDAGKSARKQEKRANKAAGKANQIEFEAGELEKKASQKYIEGMHQGNFGKVVGAVALSSALVASAGLLAIEGANAIMNNEKTERWLFKNDWGTWIETRDFVKDPTVSGIYSTLDEKVFGPMAEAGKTVGEFVSPVTDALQEGVENIFNPTIEVKVVVGGSNSNSSAEADGAEAGLE